MGSPLAKLSLAALLLALLASAGCGGGDGADSSGEAAAPPPTRPEFIKQADAICRAADARQATELRAFKQDYGAQQQATKAGQEEILREVTLPSTKLEFEQLRGLAPPDGDEVQVDVFLDKAEAAVAVGEQEPSRILAGAQNNPFDELAGFAEELGFETCGYAA